MATYVPNREKAKSVDEQHSQLPKTHFPSSLPFFHFLFFFLSKWDHVFKIILINYSLIACLIQYQIIQSLQSSGENRKLQLCNDLFSVFNSLLQSVHTLSLFNSAHIYETNSGLYCLKCAWQNCLSRNFHSFPCLST